MRSKSFSTAVFLYLAMLVVPASAAVIEYAYQGAPVSCGGAGHLRCEDDYTGTTQPGMSGTVVIDTQFYPGGLPLDSSFSVYSKGRSKPLYSYYVYWDNILELAGYNLSSLSDIPFLVEITGDIAKFFNPGYEGPNFGGITFDYDGYVVGWGGDDIDGGSTD